MNRWLSPQSDRNLNLRIITTEKIKSLDEIELGCHGIYIRKGYLSGTFLPQVAAKTSLALKFLGQCTRDKAGLGWEGWKKS
jgi:AMMECR1 domain-containing protein